MSTELHPALDQSLGGRFATVAADDRVMRTVAALEANGMSVLRAANAAEAKRIVLGLVPAGSEVYHGASQSLDVSGIVEEIERPGRYEPLHPRVLSMDRETQGDDIRRLTASPDVMLGSVHAVTETGSLLAASASGSQLGPYASGAGRSSWWPGRRRSCPTSRTPERWPRSPPSRGCAQSSVCRPARPPRSRVSKSC